MHLTGDQIAELRTQVPEDVLRELLVCPRCRSHIFDILTEPADRILYPVDAAAVALAEDLLERAARVEHEGDRAAEQELQMAGPVYDELMAYPADRRLQILRSESKFMDPAVAGWLVAGACEAASHDPHSSLHLATLALTILDGVTDSDRGHRAGPRRSHIARIKVGAYCLLAEAHRLQGELDVASDILLSAAHEVDDEPLTSQARAILCETLANLRVDQQLPDEALGLLARARALYDDLRDFDGIARVRLAEGLIRLEEAECETAVLALNEALALLDASKQPVLSLGVLRGLALTYADLGDLQPLEEILGSLGTLEKQLLRPADSARIGWTRAEVDWRSGEEQRAIDRLREVFDELVRDELPVEAALASLELARWYLERDPQSDLSPLSSLLDALKPLVLTSHLPPQLWSVLSFVLTFVQARKGAYLDVLETAAVFLRQAQFNPALRYQPLRDPDSELEWDGLSDDERLSIARQAGVTVAPGEPPGPCLADVITWTHEAVTGVRIHFGVFQLQTIEGFTPV